MMIRGLGNTTFFYVFFWVKLMLNKFLVFIVSHYYFNNDMEQHGCISFPNFVPKEANVNETINQSITIFNFFRIKKINCN